MSKVLVIGLDGATFDIIDRLQKEGRLPHISRLRKGGVSSKLLSTVPPLSPVAWTSFMTGVNPGQHGIFDFWIREEGTYKLLPNRRRFSKTIWSIANSAGKKVCVYNIPATYPVESVDGLMVCGEEAMVEPVKAVHPPQLYQELTARFGRRMFEPAISSNEDEMITGLRERIDLRKEMAKYLMSKVDWELAIVVFTASDIVQHFFWKYLDGEHPNYGQAIFNIYQMLDEAIGELLQEVDDTTNIILLSDHGFGPLHQTISLNRWLVEKGYLSYKPEVASWRRTSSQMIIALLRRLGGRKFPRLSSLFTDRIDWEKTKAYFLGTYGNIYINLKGREPGGIVSPGREYEDLRRAIIEELADIKDEKGCKVINKIWKGEEIFHGSAPGRPDLLAVWESGVDVSKEVESTFLLKRLKPIRWSGTHSPEGVLVMKGPEVDTKYNNQEMDPTRITDIAPSVCHLLGIPVPSWMDGKVLPSILKDAPVSLSEEEGKEERKEESYSPEEMEAIKNRLRNLGYME